MGSKKSLKNAHSSSRPEYQCATFCVHSNGCICCNLGSWINIRVQFSRKYGPFGPIIDNCGYDILVYSGRNPNPRKSGLPPKYLGGLAPDCPGLPRFAPDCPVCLALVGFPRRSLERESSRERVASSLAMLAACLARPPSSADRRPWWQHEQQGPSMYVQGLVARIHLLDGAGRFGRGQAVQLLASSV